MNTTVPYIQDNTAFNPLYAMMRERFCSDGTLAEKMAAEAGLCKRHTKRAAADDYRSRSAHALPHPETKKRLAALRNSIFNLKNFGAISMTVLVMGILFLSGTSFDGVQKSFTSHLTVEDGAAKIEELSQESDDLALYCAPIDSHTAL